MAATPFPAKSPATTTIGSLPATATKATGRRSARGFASMDPQRQREIATQGGRAAHEKGTAHEFTSEEARAAGRKGGLARKAKYFTKK